MRSPQRDWEKGSSSVGYHPTAEGRGDMNIVVLGGCGDMGSYAVRGLLAYSEAHITILRRG